MALWYNGDTMDETHTKSAEVSTNNGHDTNVTAKRGRSGIPADCLIRDDPATEVPEVFQMPPAPTRRILGRVHKVGPAPFVFVDDFADQSE